LKITCILRRPTPSLLSLFLLAAGGSSATSHADSLDEALTSGTPSLDMRLRYEGVDDSVNKNAKAGTLRTRLGYSTGKYYGLSAFGEFEDVRTVAGLNDYAPIKSGYAVVADPEVTQLNQAFLSYSVWKNNKLKLGRQRLILDNARFIGNVGWRQNEQTFDAVSFVNTSLSNTTITYAYLDKVNGILSKFDADVSDHLINVKYEGLKPVKLTAYGYLLEDDDSGATNDTYGLRAKGKTSISETSKLLYTAEFSTQSTNTNDAAYSFLEAGMAMQGITVKLGYEVLGSDGGAYGFQTPLATKHAFNGWADQFLVTPADGLQDMMLTLVGKVKGTKLMAVYHDYSADEGSANYGSELNLLAAKKFSRRYTLGLKYASYSADTFKTDTDKLWVWAQMKI